MELANLNSLKMAPNETGSDFINRILEAKVKLTQYGYLDLQDDIHLLEPVGTPEDWAQIECQICPVSDDLAVYGMPNVTWDDAVEQLTVHECLTMKESSDAKTEKVNTLTTKPTAKYHSKPAMRYRRCNQRGFDGQPRSYRENPHTGGE